MVFDDHGRALYFSRSMIPRPREWDDTSNNDSSENDAWLRRTPAIFHQHVGLYAYRREFLLRRGVRSAEGSKGGEP